MKRQFSFAVLGLGALLMVGCTAPNALSTQTNSSNEISIRTITNNPILSTEVFVERVNMSAAGDLKRASIAIKTVVLITKTLATRSYGWMRKVRK